jgi:hypothetical protein
VGECGDLTVAFLFRRLTIRAASIATTPITAAMDDSIIYGNNSFCVELFGGLIGVFIAKLSVN